MTAPGDDPRLTSLVRAGEQTAHISLDLADLTAGDTLRLEPGLERVLVMLSGEVRVVSGDGALGVAGGRSDVFDGPADAVYLPPAAGASLVGGATGCRIAVAAADAGTLQPGEARIIPARAQTEAVAGRDLWQRLVRTILGPGDPASRLLVGETTHPIAGTWSSFPPHRHDRDAEDEVRLEEVYYYRVQPAEGFGVQVRYDTDSGVQEARMVRDGDAAAITAGFHPVAAAPGYRLYYLWIMAGEGRAVRPFIDPRYRWLT